MEKVSRCVDVYFKGFKGVDWEAAYQTMRNTLREKHPGRHKEDSYAGRPDLSASRICRH